MLGRKEAAKIVRERPKKQSTGGNIADLFFTEKPLSDREFTRCFLLGIDSGY